MSSFLQAVRQSLGLATPVSRSIAKERLSIMLVHQRNLEALSSIDMDALKHEVAMVVKKYVKLSHNGKTNFACETLYFIDLTVDVIITPLLCYYVK